MSEETLPKAFPEARPPGVPDAITRQSAWMYAFAVVAAILIVNSWNTVARSEPGLIDYRQLIFLLVPSALMPVIAVVLLVRHPDAVRTMPLLVFGLGLFSAVELLEALDTPIYDVLIGPDLVVDGPAVVAYGVFKSLVSLFGVLYLGGGISAARRLGPTSMQRAIAIWLVALAVVGIVIGPLALASMIGDLGAVDIVAAVIGIALALAVTLAWAYVVLVTVDGSLAGEAPRLAWRLAAVATVLLFAFRILSGLFVAFGEAAFTVSVVAGYVSIGAWLLLLMAFAVGMPAPAGSSDREAATGDRPGGTQPGS